MVAPTISMLTPAEGLTIGETFVVIDGADFNDAASGGTVKVYFGGVLSPEFGVVDTTKIVALTPPGTLGAVDVTVENVTPNPTPPPDDLVEPTTLVNGFEYKRPSIETRGDQSNSSFLLLINRELIKELRRTVLENVTHDMHPEYADADSATAGEETQSSAPSIKLLGPVLQEDRFHSLNGRHNVQLTPSPGTFSARVQPVTMMLEYQYVGVGRTKGETMNLFAALLRYFNRTPFLAVPQDGLDPVNGVNEYELEPVWEQRAEFAEQASRQGVYQFSGAFRVRGVHLVSEEIAQGADVTECLITIEKIT